MFVVTVVDNRQKAMALGADGFYAKPVDRSWLIEQLNLVAHRQFGRRVLIIDDDEVSRYLVKTIFAQTEFRFSEASGGNEGLQRANDGRPDLVILDLAMPDLSGFEVLNKLKENPRTADIPVIIHTSKTLDARERSLLSSAVAVISKDARSRELSLAHFADAFSKAGFSLALRPGNEARHV